MAHRTKVEFYFLGGAVLFQAFAAAPGTARVTAMFKPAGAVLDAAEAVAAEAGVGKRWWVDAVRNSMLADGGTATYLELTHVAVFGPVPAYVLAVKCAALGVDGGGRTVEDVRYLLRAMNVRSTEDAMAAVRRYFTERQLAPDTERLLEGLLEA